MTTIGRVFIPLNREHDGTVPTDGDEVNFESLAVPLRLWEPFEQCLSKHLSELTEGQIDREEKFWFEAAHVNAMIAVVEAEAVTAAPDLRNWCRKPHPVLFGWPNHLTSAQDQLIVFELFGGGGNHAHHHNCTGRSIPI
jgi:hypothetical protein